MIASSESAHLPLSEQLTPTLEDRVFVHRRVEWLVARQMLPHPKDLAKNACVALANVGIDMPFDQPARTKLLIDEVRRALPRGSHQARHADFEVFEGPVDPDGSIAGGRIGVSRMLCRRTDCYERSEAGIRGELWLPSFLSCFLKEHSVGVEAPPHGHRARGLPHSIVFGM